MSNDSPTAPGEEAPHRPLVGYSALTIALRYLLKKKLSYLAIVGIMLSVGTLIVVMSVFTGFHMRLEGAIRGCQSDLMVRPSGDRLYGIKNWQAWREQVLEVAHVEGAAPFVEGIGVLRLPGSEFMSHVILRGVVPELEPQVSDLKQFMIAPPGELGGLNEARALPWDPDSGRLRTVFVGRQFPGFATATPDEPPPLLLPDDPRKIILVTATPALDRRLAVFAVRGMFQTGHIEYDSKFAVMSLQTAQNFVGAGEGVSGLSVRLEDYDEHVEQVREALERKLQPGAVLRRLGGAAGRVAISGHGFRIAALTDDGQAVVKKAGSAEEVFSLPGSGATPVASSLDPPGDHLATGYDDGSASVHRTDTGEELWRTLPGGTGVTTVCFSPDALMVGVGFEDGSAVVYDSELGDELAVLRGHSGRVNSLTFDRASRTVATCGADGAVCLWDAESGRRLLRLAAGGPVGAAAFSRGGALLVTGGSQDGALALWDAQDGRLLQRWGGGSPVLSVAFGWQPTRVIAASADGIRFWDTGGKRVPFGSVRPATCLDTTLRSASISEDGDYVVAATPEGPTLIYAGEGFTVRSWEDQNSVLLEAVGMERFLMALIVSLILVVAEFLIFTIVTTIVAERRRDIGIMKAIGFTRAQIGKVFVLVGLSVGLLGATLGVAGGLFFSARINLVRDFVRDYIGYDPFPPSVYYFKDIPAHTGVLTVVLTAGGAILCALLFSLLPAIRAARMDPVQTLHHE